MRRVRARLVVLGVLLAVFAVVVAAVSTQRSTFRSALAAASPGVAAVADPGPASGAVAPDDSDGGGDGDGGLTGPFPGGGGLTAVAHRTGDPESPAGAASSGPDPGGDGPGRPGLSDPGTGGADVELPPDGTPLAAAAGSEPGSMQPVDLLSGWTASVHRFDVGGITRSYLMVRPRATSATPLPVLMVLHGRDLTPAGIERLSGLWRSVGPSIQVYPAGYGRSWNAGGCCGEAFAAGIDDVTFLRDVVHSVLSSQHDADQSSVSAVGFSNGGRMAYHLACDAPGTVGAVVAVEAVPVDQCTGTTPLPVLIVANRFDPLLTIPSGAPPKVIDGVREPTVAVDVERWRAIDGCSATRTVALDGQVTLDTYDHCAGAGRVEFAEYAFGRHDWSPGNRSTPSAATVVAAFLDGGELPAGAHSVVDAHATARRGGPGTGGR